MIFHTIEHRKPGHEGLEAIYQQEDQHIAEGASCFVCGGPQGFPFIRWAGSYSQVDLNPECALRIGVRLMREVKRSKIGGVLGARLREVGMIRKDGVPGRE